MLQTNKRSTEQILFIFLGVWTFLNIIQSVYVDVHADEAYYWMYSRFLDWGYFDHPPMVALFMKIGDALLPSTLGLRLFTVITSTLSVYLLWEIVKPYSQNIKLFILLFLSVVLFHVYGFITTPDAPLFFFSVLFFYVYQRYVAADQLKWALLLALIIACLLYSKYHGILILFFTILSNLKLLKRFSFWLIVAVAALAFLPHIYWQIQNNYPSFYYHVIDRSAAFYKFNFTSDYILAQLALAGPLVGWFLYKSAIGFKTSDAFIRAVKFNGYCIFVFFLFSTLKGRVEAHWTLPGMLCLFILAYVSIAQKGMPKWFEKLAVANIIMVIVIRVILIIPIEPLMKVKAVSYYFGNKKWAEKIHEKAGDAPVIFTDSFQVPSRYNYYNRTTKGFAYNSRNYRRNQYDIWPLEDSIRNKKAYYVLQFSHGDQVKQDTINTEKGVYYGTWIDNVRMYQKVNIDPVSLPLVWKKGERLTLKLKISNPYQDSISLGNINEQWQCSLEYGFKSGEDLSAFEPVVADIAHLKIAAKQSVIVQGTIRAPMIEGKYKLIFSLRTAPFAGSRNSNMISIEVK